MAEKMQPDDPDEDRLVIEDLPPGSDGSATVKGGTAIDYVDVKGTKQGDAKSSY